MSHESSSTKAERPQTTQRWRVDAASLSDHENYGFLVHEIRNLLSTATVAFEVLKGGNAGVGGEAERVLGRSLSGLRHLIDGSIADIRLRQGTQRRTHFAVADLVAELAAAAALEAGRRGLDFSAQPGAQCVVVHADREVLAAAIANLLQNAFKFTRPGTAVRLSVAATADRVCISIADECGGLAAGAVDELFRPYEQRGGDRTGLGLGLAFCRRGVEANNGNVSARDLPGHGCVFTVDLPRVERALAVS